MTGSPTLATVVTMPTSLGALIEGFERDSLDSLRPKLPPPPGAVRRWIHRAGVVLGWTVGYRRVPHLDASLQAVFPWALSLAIALPLAAVFDGAIRQVAAGVCAGLTVGGLFAWGQQRGNGRRAAAHLLGREVELLRYAEDRATSVARQFSWAVDDLLQMRRVARDRDAKIQELSGELAEARSAIQLRDRELAHATQKVFEVGLFDVDRERSRLIQMEQTGADIRRELQRATDDNVQLTTDLAVAAGRIAALSGALRRITEVTSGAEHGAAAPGILEFLWKLEWDGRENVLRVRLADQNLIAESARILDGDTVIASQSEAASGEISIDHDRIAGWQSLVVDDAIVGRFRRSDHEGLRFEFLVFGDWLVAAPQAPPVLVAVSDTRIWSLDGRRAAKKSAV